MPKYENGKIYRIICNQTGLQYVGSTTIPLSARLSQHKKVLKDGISGTSKLVLENGDYSIILLEDFPCERKEQLLQRERYYIETMNCVNKKIPNRSQKEWYIDNREAYIEKQKIWNNQNKHKLRQYQETFKNKNKGIFIDLTNIDVDDDDVKLNIEDIYDCDELLDKEELIELLEKKISDNIK